MKYIYTDALGFVLFSNHLDHDAFARQLRLKKEDILSAGHVNMDSYPECYGKSISLGIQSKADDTAKLRFQLTL